MLQSASKIQEERFAQMGNHLVSDMETGVKRPCC
jgi:hypothetical protein